MKNCIQEFFEAIRNDNLPVFLYGCGAGVTWFIKFMNNNNVIIEGIIDGKLSGDEEYEWNGIKVMSLTQVSNKYCEAHIVISAPAHRKEIRKTLQDTNNAKWYIYTFDPTVDVQQGNTAAERLHYFKRHANELKDFYDRLADKKSRQVLTQIIKGSLENDSDCYEMIAGESQYFPDFVVSNLTDEETFLDAGAYIGDSISEFISVVHDKYKKIYAFEPDKMNIAIAKKELKDDRIVFYEKGVGESEEILYFKNESDGVDEGAHVVSAGSPYTTSVQIVRIDDVIKDKVTYIKMDIEGMELSALRGAKMLIRKYKPMLAISIYHRTEDVVQIPQYIMNELNGEYKLYLRHYWAHNGTDTVLFAI